MPTTTGMKGSGFYDRHSAAQRASMELLQEWVEAAAAAVPLPAGGRPVTLLDLGSSEGRNAIGAMLGAAHVVRGRTSSPVVTVYSDLPGNNFNRLFLNLEEARRSGEVPAGVFPAAAAGSFYGPVMPPGSVHLATTFNSVLWLDRPPGPAPDYVAHRRPFPHAPGLPAQAEAEMRRFFEARAGELVPGGRLLVAAPGDTDTSRISGGLYDVLDDACRDLVAAGRVERARYERLTMPVYFRTVGEMLAAAGPAFAVERAESLEVPTPFVEVWRRTGDTDAYADDYAGFLRAFSEPVVRAALVPPGGDPVVLDALYGRVRERLRAEPARYVFRYTLTAVLLARR